MPIKSMSRPKAPASKAIKEIFESIREEKNGKKLLEMIQKGEIDLKYKNEMGQCPFLFAVDCEFEISILEGLLSEGCDLNSKD